jgi:type I restriction enzyme, S subunit
MTFTSTPLRYLAEVRVSNVDKKTADGERSVQLCNYTDVYYQSSITGGLAFMAASATSEQVQKFSLRTGDSIITKDSETAADIAVPAFVREDLPNVLCGYHLALIRPRTDLVNPAYLSWALQSDFMREQFSVRASGVTRYGLTYEAIQGTQVPVATSPGGQQRIADFLDDQVTRIGEAISLRSDQRDSIANRQWNVFLSTLEESRCVVTPLRRLFKFLADGPFGSAFTSADYSKEGHPVVRLGNIGFAEFRNTDLVHVPQHVFRRFPRSHTHEGDLLIASLGDERNHAGRACLAPNSLDQGMVKGKCFIARVYETRVEPLFVATLLSSPLGAEIITQAGRGSTRQMINMEILREACVPVPSLVDQRRLVKAFTDANALTKEINSSNNLARSLLKERKAALITAAVTGEFDVTTAGPRAAAAVTG